MKVRILRSAVWDKKRKSGGEGGGERPDCFYENKKRLFILAEKKSAANREGGGVKGNGRIRERKVLQLSSQRGSISRTWKRPST